MGDERALGNPSDPLQETCPNVYDFLTNTDVDKERIKSPAFLTIQPCVGGYLAVLKDPDMGCSVEVPLNNAQDVWTALENGLVNRTAVVKVWGKKGVNFRKRKPKS